MIPRSLIYLILKMPLLSGQRRGRDRYEQILSGKMLLSQCLCILNQLLSG